MNPIEALRSSCRAAGVPISVVATEILGVHRSQFFRWSRGESSYRPGDETLMILATNLLQSLVEEGRLPVTDCPPREAARLSSRRFLTSFKAMGQ